MSDGDTGGSRGAHGLRVLLACALGLLTLCLYAKYVDAFLFVGDDAFISYRYSRNLFEGHGLAWNPGEPPVEGYTSFTWIGLGVLAFALHLPPERVAVSVTVASGAAILVLLYLFCARRRGYASPLAFLPSLCLASNRTFAAWSSGGLDTQFYSLTALVSALVFLRERERRTRVPIISALCFAFATLTRPEGVLPAFAVGCLFLWEVAFEKRRAWRSLLVWVAIYVAIVGAHLLWRHGYYGYWLPNTYYAKVSGRVRITEGLAFVRLFLHEYQLAWFLPLVLVPVLLRRRAEDFLFLAFLAAEGAYVIWVGGDWMEYRFANALLPYLYWLIVEGLAVLMGLVRISRASELGRTPIGGMLGAMGSVALILLVVATLQSVLRDDVETAEVRANSGIVYPMSDVRSGMLEYARRRAEQGKRLRGWVERGLLPADLRIAVGGAGALPYYSRLYTVDVLGWNDVAVAHGPVTVPGKVGHEKQASPEYLRERGVELVDAANDPVRFGDPADFVRAPEPRYFYRGEMVCYEVEPGWYLYFGTTLDEARLAERFGHLRRVF